MAKSIIQTEEYCYLCSLLDHRYTTGNLEEHHVVFGPGRRPLSDKYGLTVKLCRRHHRTSMVAVHRCAETALLLKAEAQRAFEKKYGHEKWMGLFNKNYIYDEQGKEDKTKTEGFRFLSEDEQSNLFGPPDERSCDQTVGQ